MMIVKIFLQQPIQHGRQQVFILPYVLSFKFYCDKFPSNHTYFFVDLACSGKFWKKMDHIFAAVNADDMQNMKDQVIIKIPSYIIYHICDFSLGYQLKLSLTCYYLKNS